MSESDERLKRQTASSLVGQCCVLALVVIFAFPWLAFLGFRQHSWDGVAAVAVAGSICFLAGCLALVVTWRLRSRESALNGLLLSMICRTGIPLLVAAVLSMQGGWLAEAGVFGKIMLYYLIVLFAETYLAVRTIKSSDPASGALSRLT